MIKKDRRVLLVPMHVGQICDSTACTQQVEVQLIAPLLPTHEYHSNRGTITVPVFLDKPDTCKKKSM
jgi:hypothetical protein